MQDTTQQQPTLCDLHVDETMESPALGGPVPSTEPGELNAAEGTRRKGSFTRILLRALGAWAS